MSGPIYNAVRRSQGSQASTVVGSQTSPIASSFSDPKAATYLTKADLRAGTKHRKRFAIVTSVFFFIALVMLILVQIGNLSNNHVLGDLFFFKIDTTNIILADPGTNSKLQQSIAESSGLHDFYQVGMWNFCEGYNDVGITACSRPALMYWFNPVQIILDELLNGKQGPSPTSPAPTPQTNKNTVTLPEDVSNYLTVIRAASHVMFAMFFASTFTSFLLIFLCPLAVYSRLVSIPIALFALISGLMTFIAAGISTGMWLILKKDILANAADINIVPSIGTRLFILMWIAAGCSLFAALGQVGMMCCGTSRRDIKTGRRPVGRKARNEGSVPVEENPALRRRWWGSVSQ
ncbi:hypothetical protein MMC17_002163 [Xylographa soralifera]|nr:hypothetical protein [Xylographa soralifera]